jgi:SAM-dependent methyltransferase
MTEISDRVRRYVLDGADADLRRLLKLAAVTEDLARTALRRVGVTSGWKVVDCGCGPLGALGVMSDMVGPSGTVAGFDFHAPTVERARVVLRELGLHDVTVVHSDVHDVEVAALGGPFDLAFTRFFLMHQEDPVDTLASIARLVRPGGWIVALEPLRTPAPLVHPGPVPALSSYWNLMQDMMEQAGVARDGVANLADAAIAAGLEVIHVSGVFAVAPAEPGLELHRATLTAIRDRVIEAGLATGSHLDAIEAELSAAAASHAWTTSGFMLELALRRP